MAMRYGISRRRYVVVASLALALLLVAAVGASVYWNRPHVLGTIDCSVPNTKVYLGPRLLGVTPVVVTSDDIAPFGPFADSDKAFLGYDGYGEFVFYGAEDQREIRFTLQAPDDVANQYVSCETPWGKRTKSAGCQIDYEHRNFVKANLMKTPALRVILSIVGEVERDDDQFEINLTAVNNASHAILGKKPSVQVLFSGEQTPWRRRSGCSNGNDLPEGWSSFAPGESKIISLKVPSPRVAGNYSVFCLLNSFSVKENPGDGDYGVIYSDSTLLRVR